MRTKPDYNLAQNMARDVLLEHNVTKLPVDVCAIIESLPDIKLISYSELQKMHNLTEKQISDTHGSEDGVIRYSSKKRKYFIAYNENVVSKNKINWTLAHELGHYMLNHLHETDSSLSADDRLSKTENYVVESEANAFTRELLAPPPVLRALNVVEVNDISDFCGLTITASKQIEKFLTKGKEKFNIHYSEDNPIRVLFAEFINQRKHTNRSETEKIPIPVQKCPNCNHSVRVQALNYCIICGVYLINKCTGFDLNDNDSYKQSIKWHEHNEGCGEILEENARFCPKCGSTSTFFENGLLKKWDGNSSSKLVAVPNNDG